MVSYRRDFLRSIGKQRRWSPGKQCKRRGNTETIVSYDLNYRDSLWKSIGGKARAQEVNRELAPLVDVMLAMKKTSLLALALR